MGRTRDLSTLLGFRHGLLGVLRKDRRRARFFRRAAAFSPYVALTTEQGEIFFVATGESRLRRGFFIRQRTYDMVMVERAVATLAEHGAKKRGGSVFVDVGANIGTTTVTAMRRLGFDHAVSVEPDPANFRMLRLNLIANGIDAAVTPIQAAVSDAEGEILLATPESETRSPYLLVPGVKQSASSFTVPALTLDGLARQGLIDPASVGLLWIDAAGSEPRVLAGASKLLEAGVPVVTAVKRKRGSWKARKASLVTALGGYTDFVELRKQQFSNDLEGMLESFGKGSKDLLAFRR